MANKRKSDSLVSGQFNIKVAESELLKSKLYLRPPTSLKLTSPPGKSSDSWFTFSTIKEYYPVAIYDAHDVMVVDLNKPITFSIFSNSKEAIPFEVSTKPLKNGVYWFSAIKAHVPENFTLRFFCDDDAVESLNFEVEVVSSSKGKMATKAVEELEQDCVPDNVVSSKSKATSSKRVAAVDVVEGAEEDDERQAIASDSLNHIESVLPMPRKITLSNKTRLEQPLRPRSTSEGGITKFVDVVGSQFQISFPVALARAVLDDKAINATRLVEYLAERGDASGSGQKGAAMPLNLQHPTVNELLHQLQERAGAVLQTNVTGLVDTLRQLFELFLEEHLLFPSEREAFRDRLDHLRSQKLPFADEFGAYYYLRLLLLVITGSDNVKDDVNGALDASSNVTKLNGRQSRNSASKMQELLDFAVTLLDERAHALFY